MTVYYAFSNMNQSLNVVKEFKGTGGCFGALNANGRFPSYAFYGDVKPITRNAGANGMEYARVNSDEIKADSFVFNVMGNPTTMKNLDGNNVGYSVKVRDDARAAGKSANRFAYELLKELFDDIPFYRDFVSFHYIDTNLFPALNMHFNITPDTPADKVITAAFLARNLIHYGEYDTYKYIRSLGYKPFFSAMITHIAELRADNGVNPFGAAASLGRYSTRSAGEYNWFHPRGLGKEGAIQLMAGEEPDWALPAWQTLNGYRRENWFTNNHMSINGRNQILIDWATVPGDREHFLSNLQFGENRFIDQGNGNFETALQDVRRFAELLNNEYNINVIQQEAQ